jgi:hypothetical protein
MGALRFSKMSEAELREWVEANPGRVNEMDSSGDTLILIAICVLQSLPLVVWLLDEKGANINARCKDGMTALYGARSVAVLNALFARGARTLRC